MESSNTISYADDWKDAYSPVYKQEEPVNEVEVKENKSKEKKTKEYSKPYLVIFQLVLCALILLFAFGVKTFGGDLYNNLHKWYYESLNDEIIMSENFNSLDLDSIFK